MAVLSHPPELLAPAGDWNALRAAVANGADAVYFGLDRFNARHRATNFSHEDLPKVIRYLHDRNVKGFLTFNTLIFSDELEDAAAYIREVAEAGIDALIVQDVGIARLIHRIAPDLPIHASTQMTLSESRGIQFVREKLFVERAVMARELSISDIRKIGQETSVPLEVFIHGALCVAYSGQCLTSESLGGRSANRGQCAQACRLPYEMIVDGKSKELGDRAYLLSPQDLAGYDQVADLVDAGVASFKIEGRLKSSHYVAAATQTYRGAIDSAREQKAFELSQEASHNLSLTYSRGFIPGFLEGVNHQQTVEGRVPKARGLLLGRVSRQQRNGIIVRLEDSVSPKPGDGVVFDLGKPDQQEPGGRLWAVEALGPNEALIRLDVDFDSSNIPNGCRVWKTDDPVVKKELEQSYQNDPIYHRVPVHVKAVGNVGGALTIFLSDDTGLRVEVSWLGPLEVPRKHPFNGELLREQFDRLGDTPFQLGRAEIDCPQPVLVPKSILNDLRRQAVQKLCELRIAREAKAIAEPEALKTLRSEIPKAKPSTRPPSITVLVRNLDQLAAVLEDAESVSMVYCDFEDLRKYKEAVPLARAREIPIGLAPLRIQKPGEEGFLSPILHAQPDAVLIRNLAALLYFQEKLPSARLIGDFSLNVANELTAAFFVKSGLERLIPSFDLNWEQFQALMRRVPVEWFEPVIHQHMPMFHMEHCVFAAFLSNGRDFRDCGRPCDDHKVELRDRVNADFPVIPDTGCRNTVYNSQAQSAIEYLPQMQALGLSRFRIDLLRERGTEVQSLLTTYRRVLAGQEDGKETWKKLRVMNQLGVTRGTLKLV